MSPLVELGAVALGLYLAGWLSGKLGLSPIVGYISLGLLLGPYGVYTVFEGSAVTTMLGELGIIMLLFYMGLEFSLRRFMEGGRAIVQAGSLDLLNFAVGALVGLALGLGWLAALFLAGIVYISSSGVITKLLVERELIANPEAERALGILVYEDLAMIFILSGLSFLTVGGGLLELLSVVAFLVLYVLLLRYGMGAVERLFGREGEVLILIMLAVVILFSTGAQAMGFPEAVAAFLLGMLLGESRFKGRFEETLAGWRDVAAAVFFLDFGLHVDLSGVGAYLPAALVLIVLTTLSKSLTSYAAGRTTGLSRRASVGLGLMLLPRGEFSLVIAGLAASAVAIPAETRAFLVGVTSVYIIALVILGSVIYRYYGPLTERLLDLLGLRGKSAAESKRQADLEGMTLD